jgi:hypothetical protein
MAHAASLLEHATFDEIRATDARGIELVIPFLPFGRLHFFGGLACLSTFPQNLAARQALSGRHQHFFPSAVQRGDIRQMVAVEKWPKYGPQPLKSFFANHEEYFTHASIE